MAVEAGERILQALGKIGKVLVADKRNGLFRAELGQLVLGEDQFRLVGDAEIGAAVADIDPRIEGLDGTAFADTGG